jgi:hypothetical protein
MSIREMSCIRDTSPDPHYSQNSRPLVAADLHHFEEEQDPDPDPHCSEKRDLGQDPQSQDADPQPCLYGWKKEKAISENIS